MPVIFVVAGLLLIPAAAEQLPLGWQLGIPDVALIAAELALALVVGWQMGRLTEIATRDGVVSSRLGRAGVAVWLGFIVARIGLGVAGIAWHAPLATLPAVIFLVVATIKVTQAVVVRKRVAHHEWEQIQLDQSTATERMAGADHLR